jgi:hypothetical protein
MLLVLCPTTITSRHLLGDEIEAPEVQTSIPAFICSAGVSIDLKKNALAAAPRLVIVTFAPLHLKHLVPVIILKL